MRLRDVSTRSLILCGVYNTRFDVLSKYIGVQIVMRFFNSYYSFVDTVNTPTNLVVQACRMSVLFETVAAC